MDPAHTLGIREQVRRRQLERGDGPAVIVTGSIPKRVRSTPTTTTRSSPPPASPSRSKWQSTVNIGATSYKYTLWLECLNAQYMDGGPEALANKRRHGGSFNWKSTYAGTAGSTKSPSSTRPPRSYG
jgi:hypothetical protein